MCHFTIPVFIPELACPNRCVFCNQRKISGALCQLTQEEVIETIEKRLSTIASGNEVEIGFFGGNFTGIEPELQEKYLSIAQHYVESGQVKGIRLSTRPDYISLQSLSMLGKYSVSTIELGAQSLDEEVLKLAGRGHTVEDVRTASRMILDQGFKLGLQMMIGLPGDSLEKSIDTARQIVELGACNTRIYPTLVIKETELENRYRNGEYLPLTLEDAIQWTKEVVRIFEEGNVTILRIGLHPSEGILSGDALVAGPFHVAFGEMVQSALWREVLSGALSAESKGQSAVSGVQYPGIVAPRAARHALSPKQHTTGRGPELLELLTVEVPVGQVNAAVGHSAGNKKMLMEMFRKVIFRENSELVGRTFKWRIG
jgi:histone acetyltransferase (RNA polymerase elongator complex component)